MKNGEVSLHDRVLLADLPVVTAPIKDAFKPLQQPGHRLVVAAGGLYKEIRRKWLYAVHQVAPGKTPYGVLDVKVRMVMGSHKALLDEFVIGAKKAAPNEIAAWIVWNENTGATRLLWLDHETVSPGHVTVIRPQLADGEHLMVDVHSHHDMKPFFSAQDDQDDLFFGDVHIAAVVGHISTQPTWAFRLCLEGHVLSNFNNELTIGELP